MALKTTLRLPVQRPTHARDLGVDPRRRLTRSCYNISAVPLVTSKIEDSDLIIVIKLGFGFDQGSLSTLGDCGGLSPQRPRRSLFREDAPESSF